MMVSSSGVVVGFIRRRFSVLSFMVLMISSALGAHAQSAYITDVYWSGETDANSDGYMENAQLNWELDTTGGILTVYEKIYYRVTGTLNWTLLRTTSAHQVYGFGIDYPFYTIVALSPNNKYDFRIEVWRSGAGGYDDYDDGNVDNVLSQYKMGPGGGVGGGSGAVTIYDASWTNTVDADSDGYWESGRLTWDPDVSSGYSTQTVYEKLYFRLYGTTDWIWFYDTSPHIIYGSSSSDVQFLDYTAMTRGVLDFKIDIYRVGQGSPDYSRSPSNDSSLTNIKLGPKGSNGNWVFISDAWWTNEVDADGDGYRESATLNWSDLVVNGASSLTVNEKIYYRTAGTSTWTYLTSRSNHTINKTTPIASSVDISPAFLAGYYDFRIEIYRNGIATPDYARDPSTDGDMNRYPMGASTNLYDTVVLSDVSWSNLTDLNSNGYKSSFRLNWNPEVGAGNETQMVYEKVYYKKSSGSIWTPLYTLANHSISGATPDDARYYDVSGIPIQDFYDFKIELYRTGQSTPDSTLDNGNCPALNRVLLESYMEDDPSQAVKDVTFSPDPAAIYISPVNVALATSTSLAEIHYTMTTDGSTPPDPTKGSSLYSAGTPIWVGFGTTNIKAKAWKTGRGPSAVTMATYTVRLPVHSIVRTLPAGYLPAVALTVRIDVAPDPITTLWSLDETPPSGWTVSGIGQGGTWDAAAKKVKWGPFADAAPRTLTYTVTPPFSESGSKTFVCYGTMQGQPVPASGDITLARLGDATPPRVLSFTRLDASPTSATMVRYALTFSEPVAGVDTSDFSFTTPGLIGVMVTGVTGGPAVYTVTVDTGMGASWLWLRLNGALSGIQDASGNALAGFFDSETYVIDHVAPTFVSLGVTPSPARLGTVVQIQFTASEGLQTSPTVTVNGAGAPIVAHTGLSYTCQYTIRASDADGAATVAIRGTDLTGNPGSLSNTTLLTVDKTPPLAPTSLALDPADDSGLSGYDGLTNRNSGLTVRGVAEAGATVQLWDGANLLGVASAATFGSTGYDIILNEGTHNVTAVAVDAAGNTSVASTALAIKVDQTAPLPGTASSPSYARTSPIRVTYSGAGDAQTGLRQLELWFKDGTNPWHDSGLRAIGSAGAFNFVPASPEDIYSFAIVAEDLAGNRSATPVGPGMTQTVYDTISPEVLSVNRLDATPTNVSSVRFAVSFSEPVSGLDATDFVLSASGLSGAAVSGVSGGPSDYTVTVNTGLGDGTLRLDVPGGAGTGIQDLAGNGLASGFSGGQSYRVDRSFPSFGTPSVSPSPAGLGASVSISFTVSEALMTSPTVTVGGVSVPIQSHSGLGYSCQFTVTGTDPDGPAAVAISGVDFSGNPGSFSSSSLLVIDKTAPAAPGGVALDAADDSGFASGDGITNRASGLTIRGTAEAGATVKLWEGTALLASGTAAAFASPGLDLALGEGSHTITATATDAAGNVSPASAALTILVDTAAPAAGTASAPATAKTNPIHISYSGAGDAGSGLRQLELWIKAGSGAWVDSGLRSVAASGAFDFSPASANTYAFALVAEDMAGNRSAAAAGAGDAQTDYDPSYPQVVSMLRLDATPTSATAVRYEVTFNKPVTGVDAADFTPSVVSGSLAGLLVTNVAGGPTVFTVTVSTGSGDGLLQLNLPASGTGIVDLKGNPMQNGFNGQVYAIDHLAPMFTALNASPASAAPGAIVDVNFTVSEALATSPTVTLNGNPVPLFNHTGLNYTCRYTIDAADPDGPATIRVTMIDPIGHQRIQSDLSSLAVDSAPPSSNVLATSAKQDANTLLLKWQASDPVKNGSSTGVIRIDLYCGKNYGAPFKVGSFGPSTTSTTFDMKAYGGYGQYHFYTVAVDAAGNAEAAPAAPDWNYVPSTPKNAVGGGWQRYE